MDVFIGITAQNKKNWDRSTDILRSKDVILSEAKDLAIARTPDSSLRSE